uniref:Uncharacterized protein n=1 Tax=Anguilla anguilla TaxID=7936 RepID=A0A0E9UHQ7_ANGAN
MRKILKKGILDEATMEKVNQADRA